MAIFRWQKQAIYSHYGPVSTVSNPERALARHALLSCGDTKISLEKFKCRCQTNTLKYRHVSMSHQNFSSIFPCLPASHCFLVHRQQTDRHMHVNLHNYMSSHICVCVDIHARKKNIKCFCFFCYIAYNNF